MLDKVQAGIRRSSLRPIYVPAKRTTRLDCLRCLYAFSADGLASRPFDSLPAGQKVAVADSSTRIRKCLGWVRLLGADFVSLNNTIEIDEYAESKGEGSASYIQADREYFGIVYEYIPSAKLERDAVQRQLDFFHHIGFESCQGAKEQNWQGPGILLDFGDYNAPVDQWFEGKSAYHPCDSADVLVDWDRVREEARKEWERQQELREEGIGPTEEEKRAMKKKRMSADTAKHVEWGYQANRWHTSYFDRKYLVPTSEYVTMWASTNLLATVSAEQIHELELEEDPLASIQIPEIGPRALFKTWKAYRKLREAYLSGVQGNTLVPETQAARESDAHVR